MGRARGLGGARSRRTTTRRSGCSASSPSTADDPADQLLREFGREIGADRTYAKTRVGVYFGTPGETVEDPFFGGAGPARTGCIACGRCMVGCPHNAKNTLPKNYLWLAERAGARIVPERTVVDIAPLGAADGSDGYAVTTRAHRRLAPPRPPRRTPRAASSSPPARSARTSCWPAASCAARCRGISDRLGELVRTNSEAILAVTLPRDAPEMTKRVAISSSVYPDPDTHIETVTYGDAGDSMSALYTLMVGDGIAPDPAAEAARRARCATPSGWRGSRWPRGWSRRTVIVLVMQSLDNAIALRARRTRTGGVRLTTEQDPERPNPTFIPVANQFAAWLAERTGGIAQSSIMEAMANIPTTAHILGGAVIGADASSRRRRRTPAGVRL